MLDTPNRNPFGIDGIGFIHDLGILWTGDGLNIGCDEFRLWHLSLQKTQTQMKHNELILQIVGVPRFGLDLPITHNSMKDDFSVRVERALQSSNRWVTMWCWPGMTRDDQGWPGMTNWWNAWTSPWLDIQNAQEYGPFAYGEAVFTWEPYEMGPVSGKNHFPKPLFGIPNVTLNVDVAFLGKELPWNWCLEFSLRHVETPNRDSAVLGLGPVRPCESNANGGMTTHVCFQTGIILNICDPYPNCNNFNDLGCYFMHHFIHVSTIHTYLGMGQNLILSSKHPLTGQFNHIWGE